MTLDEAIEHCNNKVKELGCTECGKEHKQLAEWLEELKLSREVNKKGGISLECYREVKRLNEVNNKSYPVGSLVYFIDPSNKQKLDWGIVSDIYSDGYCLKLYEFRDIRTIEGIPIKEYDFSQNSRKLPKGWSHNTDLIHLGRDPKWVKIMDDEKITYEKDNLLHLIDIGAFVSPDSQDSACEVQSDITKNGYKLTKNHDERFINKEVRPSYAIVYPFNIYPTWQEAQAVIDDYNNELKRQSELSDYDWSVEQIDRILNKYYINGHTEEECKSIHDFLLNQKNVEDIMVRITTRGFQWKYKKNKDWITL